MVDGIVNEFKGPSRYVGIGILDGRLGNVASKLST
jgi:hypothetical protein